VVDIGGAFLMSSFMKSEWPINQSDGLNRTFCPFLPCCPMKAFLAGSNNRLTDEKAYLRKIENSDTSTVSALREELPRCYARRRGARRSNPVSWTVGQQIPCTRSRSRRNTASPSLPGLMISRMMTIAIGALREGAVHSHTRRALEVGCSPDELRHVGVLAITTIGFPSTMAAMSWVEDILRT
jgi:hypothetical protein